ncbi:MAG: 4-hydroxy-tetrahydrodipicolinate reductase [Verrucomicrobia bacterium]|nr:4-hydroxy-tetrahydrodipicolinate reductase [Verrucomicrobiota bacterium]
MSLKILIQGALGRMGAALKQAAEEKGHEVVSEVDLGDCVEDHFSGVNLAIDFSHHSATAALAECAGKHGVPVVIGTTGHSDDEKASIVKFLEPVPIVWAGNYSLGVNLLFYLTQKASEILPNSYDVEVLEMHHRLKKDAPSGTAENLLERIKAATQRSEHDLVYGREGIIGERTDREIGVHSLRGGDVVGDHTVIFSASGERLELTHKASDRMIFARGAIHAGEWVINQPAGLYHMQDVLGLK